MADEKRTPSPIDRVWDFFISVKLAIATLIVLAVTSILGTIVEQNQPPEKYHQIYEDWAFALMDRINLFDMYHSWWFLLILVVFTVNLSCSVASGASPLLAINGESGIARGSGRSIRTLNLHEAFKACSHTLEGYGGHRMAAEFVGLLTIVIAIWTWKAERRRWMRILGVAALGTVIAQGILGGITVLYFLPPAVSSAHAAVAQTFFCIAVCIALFTGQKWVEEVPQVEYDVRRPSLVTLTILSILQFIFLPLASGQVTRLNVGYSAASGDQLP